MTVNEIYFFTLFTILVFSMKSFGQEKKYEIKLDTIAIRQMFDSPIKSGRSQVPNEIVFEETVNKLQREMLFSLEIQLPASLDPLKLNIYYFEGRRVKHIQLRPRQQSILIRDAFVSKFVGIQFFYPIDGSDRYHSCYFLMGEGPGKIKFTSSDLSNPFSSFELTNVFGLDDIGYGAYRSFVGNQFENSNNTILLVTEIRGKSTNCPVKTTSLIEKEIEFIRTHRKTYYSIVLFRNLLNDSRVATDLLRKTFDQSFPNDFKSSVEGRHILKELENRK